MSPSPPAVALHYQMIQTRNLRFEVAESGEGERLALLLHGFPESAHSFRYQVPLLNALGYRVWAPNMRGYVNTDKPRGRKAYAIDALEDDVSCLIEASGASSVTLIGHDWGGLIAWSYAMHGKHPIERLVVMNCPHPVRFQQGLLNPAQLRRSSYMFFFQLPWLPERAIREHDYAKFERLRETFKAHPENLRAEDVAVMKAGVGRAGALTSMLNYYRAMPWSIAISRRRGVRKIRVPTLLIWGEQDQALGKELSLGTERFATDLKVHYLPNASHWVQQDDPEGVNAALADFLGERG